MKAKIAKQLTALQIKAKKADLLRRHIARAALIKGRNERRAERELKRKRLTIKKEIKAAVISEREKKRQKCKARREARAEREAKLAITRAESARIEREKLAAEAAGIERVSVKNDMTRCIDCGALYLISEGCTQCHPNTHCGLKRLRSKSAPDTTRS